MKTGYDQFFKKAKESSQGRPAKGKTSLNIRKLQKQKSKPRFPLTQFFMFGFVAFLGLMAFEHSDEIESLLKKVEIGLPIAMAEEKKEEHAEAKPADAKADGSHEAKAEGEAKAADKGASESKSAAKPDEADYLFKMAERKKQLDLREEELNRLSIEINKQKDEIDLKLKKIEETRKKISAALEDKIKVDDGKVETLVQMYSNMKPQQAAKVFETLDEDLVIEILSRMKKKSAADILNLVKPEKAQVLAERYAGYRVPASK